MQAHRSHSSFHYRKVSRCTPTAGRHRLQTATRVPARQVSSTAAAGKTSSAAPEEASLELQQEHHVDFIQPLAAAPAEASLELQQERQVESWQPLAATAVLLSLAWAPDASAATVCLAVPDWVADWRGTLFHSPVVAVGVAGLALIWFPKLIRVAINYLAIPLSLAMLAYAAVSFPETTANTLYTVLEFIKEHPTASSAGIIIGAGALLGPDLLAGTAVAGVLVLLAVKLGVLQMPQLPQVPGQALLSRQLDKASKALRERMDDLDDGAEELQDRVRAGVRPDQSRPFRAQQQQQQLSTGREPSGMLPAGSGSSSSRQLDVQQQVAPPMAAADAGASRVQDGAAAGPAAAQDGAGFRGFRGFAEQVGSGAKTLGVNAWQTGKATGSAALQQGKQLRDSGAVQEVSQQAAEAAGKAAQATKHAISGLWQRGQQLGSRLAAASQSSAGVEGTAVSSSRGQQETTASGMGQQRSEQEVDAILANS